MATQDQALGCSQGDTFNFAIQLTANPDGSQPDLTGASGVWSLLEGNYDEADALITKATPVGGVIQNIGGKWAAVFGLLPADTMNLRPGLYFHKCKITLSSGEVSHIEGGPFNLDIG